MYPRCGWLQSSLVGWGLAGLLSGLSLAWLFSRGGYSRRIAAMAFAGLLVAMLVGSKLGFLLELSVAQEPRNWSVTSAITSLEFRIPAGVLLAVAVGPLLARMLGVGYLDFADCTVPASGACLVGIRLGCFFQGCCFGSLSDLPWSVSFPPYTEAFVWQVNQGLVAASAAGSRPVHPLQLYFAGAAALMGIDLWWRLPRKRFAGEVLLIFLVTYFWTTWGLELLRAKPHDLMKSIVLVAAFASSLLFGVVSLLNVYRPRRPGHKLSS